MSAYNKYGTLFADFNLRGMLEQQRSSIKVEVDALDQNRILNTAQEDLIKFYVDKNFVEAPVLRRDEWAADSHEATAVVEDFRRKITVPVTRIEVEVPFDGESTLFKGQPTQFTFSPPNARIKSNSILLTFEIRSGSNENVREKVDRELNEIEKYLEWLRSDVTAHNGALRQVAETAVNSRRTRILGNQGVLASLGIPLKERPDAPKTFASPEVRRKIVPVLPVASASPYKPEPVLTLEHYEHVLSVVQNMTHVMERSPSTFATMDEETLRDHYLVQLNGQFEGQATGETFNAGGKTDILLRIESKNAFIAECKFWKGAKSYVKTIDQLLGYSSWRDTKTAIFVFNRNRDTTKVLQEIKISTEAHPNYKRTLSWSHESGFRYVMHHPTDSNRELVMTVLVFDIPKDEKVVPRVQKAHLESK